MVRLQTDVGDRADGLLVASMERSREKAGVAGQALAPLGETGILHECLRSCWSQGEAGSWGVFWTQMPGLGLQVAGPFHCGGGDWASEHGYHWHPSILTGPL